MFILALRNLWRRPLRSGLALCGLSVAVAVLACLLAFGQGYQRELNGELNRTGVQMMLVPLGCPYDAAARVLKGKTLDNSLPESVLWQARRDPAVAVAAPMLLVALPRPQEGRTDMWAGIDQSALQLKPWWKEKAGARWFQGADSVILGDEAAQVEARAPGDKFFSPETGQTLRVAGVLQRSGTSDDSLFFVPIATAQKMFNQPKRLTAVALRLKDTDQYEAALTRLQKLRGVQVVTISEMMGTFLNLVGIVRTLLFSIALVAVTISVLGVFNTLLAAVIERTQELCLMRAFGASQAQVFAMITLESLALVGISSLCGLLLAQMTGGLLEGIIKQFLPFAPNTSIFALTPQIMLQCVLLSAGIGLCAGLYPAWQASRLQPATASKGEG
ncbi:MAG TPA: ABC transporter permease [Abditibacteriaceae bacterium]|jgi:putative ABC transport system permease protein